MLNLNIFLTFFSGTGGGATAAAARGGLAMHDGGQDAWRRPNGVVAGHEREGGTGRLEFEGVDSIYRGAI